MLHFYGRQLGNRAAIYYTLGGWPPSGPEWVISEKESFGAAVPDGPFIVDGAGNQYTLVKTVPSAPLASLHWFVYHNLGSPSHVADGAAPGS